MRYHLSTPDPKVKTLLLLSMDVRCWSDLVAHGANDIMRREYGAFLLPDHETEAEYSVSLRIELDKIPAGEGESFGAPGWRGEGEGSVLMEGVAVLALAEERAELIKSLSLLKRNALAAPFEKAFEIQKHLEANPRPADEVVRKEDVMSIHYRSVHLLCSSCCTTFDGCLPPPGQTKRSTSSPPSTASRSSSAPSSRRRPTASTARSSSRSSSTPGGGPAARPPPRSSTPTASRRSRSATSPG